MPQRIETRPLSFQKCVCNLVLVTSNTTYHPADSLSKIAVLLKPLCVRQKVQRLCRAPKYKTEILSEAINGMIGSLKNCVTCSFVNTSPNDHSQPQWLDSELDQSTARVSWHIMACRQPSLIDRVPIHGSLDILNDFNIVLFLQRKWSAGVL
jgi:hypothetical protein